MDIMYILYLLLGVTAANLFNHEIIQPVVEGGVPVVPEEIPFIGSLVYQGWHNCTVTILNEEWVLTAAQCIWGHNPQKFYIRVGSINWYSGGSLHSIVAGFSHEEYHYDDIFKKNDIAVIKVTPPMQYSSLVQPVRLTEEGSEVTSGSRAQLAGWGSATDGTLMRTDLEIFSDAECTQVYGAGFNESQVCAGVRNSVAGACEGDAGSPLMVDGVQVGLVSWSEGDCGTTPTVATQIAYFTQWIEENTHFP